MGAGESPKITGDIVYPRDMNAMAPIGTILSWAKTISGVPALNDHWLECDGSVISDAESPMDGQTLPNLNSTNRFLRGNSTSGGTGGVLTHTHTGTSDNTDNDPCTSGLSASIIQQHTHSLGTTSTGSSVPLYYDVVWIMRVK